MQKITKRKGWRLWLTAMMALFFALNLSAQVTVEIGTGTVTSSLPFYSLYEDARTQIIYDAAEILAAGGMDGLITEIGFNFSSRNAIALNGFNIDMQMTTATSLTGFVESGWTNVFSAVYTVPATGWQTIVLDNPFLWDGTSNLLVQVCFDNTNWSGSSAVYATAASGKTWGRNADGQAGCSMTGGSAQANRPNVRLTIAPPPVTTIDVQVGTGTATAAYPFYTLYEDSRTQLLYPASEILAAGGLPGNIISIGFNVSTRNALLMEGFNIDMQNYPNPTIAGFVGTGWTNVYSGTYTVPGIGQQMIDLQVPFAWDGISNLLINICFDNENWNGNSSVYGTVMPGLVAHNHADGTDGCIIATAGASYTTRANLYMTIEPAAVLPTGIVQGFVTNGYGVPIPGALVTATGDNGDFAAMSGFNGAYQIPDIAMGIYSMEASKAGYNTATVNNVLITPGETTYQNFELPRPSMAVTPNPYSVTVHPNQLYEGALNIANNGDGTLNWEAEVEYIEEDNGLAPGITPGMNVVEFSSLAPLDAFVTIGPGNGEALSSRNSMLCPDGSKFSNPPVSSDDGYNSTSYQCYQQFLGVTGSFNMVTFWALHTETPPATMNFNVQICGPGSTPGPVITAFPATATPMNTGTPVLGYPTYMYQIELPTTTMAEGWISVVATTSSPTFWWLNTYAGSGMGYQNGSTFGPDRLSMCLSGAGGGGASGWLTLGEYDGTVIKYTNFNNPAYFNATGAEAGEVYQAEVTFTSDPEVGTVVVPVTMTVVGEPLTIPESLTAVLANAVTGQVNLSWAFNPTDGFVNFVVKRNGVAVGTTSAHIYTDMLPGFGTYYYTVQAVYDEGLSAPAGPVELEWPNPVIFVDPLYIYDEVWVNTQATQTVTISNTGEGTLAFSFPDWVTDGGSRAPLAYCTSTSSTCDEYISRVQFVTIDNSSGCTNYADYTHISAEVTPGESYPITITNPSPWSSDICGVYVDWNQNESFEDAGEYYALTQQGGGASFTGNILVPDDALAGPTRMRIRLQYGGTMAPCGNFTYGEVEDYTLDVQAGGFIVAVSPAQGTVPPGGSRTVTITWDATDYEPGYSYFEDLVLESNDVSNPSVTITNEMYVFVPAQFEGIVTNALNGAPLNGVLVTAEPTGYFTTFAYDDGTAEDGIRINANGDAYLGNYFPVSLTGEINSVELYFYSGDANASANFVVEFFNNAGVSMGFSDPFSVVNEGWYTVPVTGVNFSGPFYALAHWNLFPSTTRFLGMDENGPNSNPGYGRYRTSAGVIYNLIDLGYPGTFLMRVNAFIGNAAVTLSAAPETVNTAGLIQPGNIEACGISKDSGRKTGVMHNSTRDVTTFQTMTNPDGEYSLMVNPGKYNVRFEKTGFQTYVEYDTTALAGVVTPLDAELWEESYPPAFVHAEVNETDTQCVVTWGAGAGPYEIIYDDGSAENYFAWAVPGNMSAVKFTPASYPVTVIGGKIYVGDGSFPNNNTGFIGKTFGAMVMDASGTNGMPGAVLDSISVTVNNYGWVTFGGFDVEITSGNFYIVMVQGSLSPNCAPVGIDQTLPTLYRSYTRNVATGGNWLVSAYQDMMIRAVVSGVPSESDAVVAATPGELLIPVKEPDAISMSMPMAAPGYEGSATYRASTDFTDNTRAVTSYRLIRYSNFNPNGSPLAGNATGLGNAITATTYTDGGTTWAGLPAGWYAYGVAANYPNGSISDTILSNIVGHKLLAEITVNVSLTTGGSPEGTALSFTGLDYPYEVYTATVPAGGQVVFPEVWLGHYDIHAFLQGFDPYDINVNITGDRVIDIILLETKFKPRNLYVDPLTLVATWEGPLGVAILEDFEGTAFPPAGWTATTSGQGWYGTTNGSTTYFQIPAHTRYAVANDDNSSSNNGCCDYLITPEMNWTNLPAYKLNFASYFTAAYGQMASIELSTDAGATWTVIYNLNGISSWQNLELDLTQFSGANGLSSVWLAFHSDDGGAWASGWAIDDVMISSGGVTIDQYGVFLDGTLVDNTPEETYTYTNLNYGQLYVAGVAGLFSSGYSELDIYPFRSAFLYPPDSLQGESPLMTDYVHLTWFPPTSPTGLGDNQERIVPTTTQAQADVVEVLTPRFFPQTNVPLASSRNILFDNGPLVNSPGTGSGGADESILQTGLGMTTYGYNFNNDAGYTVADDFEVTGNWNIQNIEFFGYQTGSTTTSTFTGVFCRVYDNAPNAGGTVIWGDMTTNRLLSTEWSNIYRNDDGPGGSTNRPIMKIVAETPGLTLSPGTYWVEWGTTGSLSSGPWVPAVTIQGETSTGNALQWTGSSWDAMTDVGPQGMPFILNGTGGGSGGGAVPSNLLGYNIYRDDALAAYVEHPQLEYFDLNLDPGTYTYEITAVYDLTPYGYAGQTGESMVEGPIQVSVVYGYELPFFENFTTGLFTTNQWTVDGANWRISGQAGNPAPSAEFFFSPKQTDYALSLTSYWLNGTGYVDGNIYLDFDIKLKDQNATGKETLVVEVFNGSAWATVETFTAEGDMDWESKHIDITGRAKNKVFRVRFTAKGEDSFDIYHWLIDNVHIYRECAAPTDLTAEVNFPYLTQVILNWEAPSGGGTGPGISGWLKWDNGVNDDAIGLSGGGTFNVAARFTPTQLAQYAGTSLTKIRLFPYSDGGTLKLKVWTGANASTLVLTQPLASYTGGQWNEFNLTTPVPVTGATELWFGYEVTHPNGVYVAGCDAGPAVAGFGDMISLDGSSWESMATAYGLNYNWNLQGFVETLDGVNVVLQPLNDETVYGPLTGELVRGNLPALPGAALPLEVADNSRELTGYNVYRDGALIGSTSETTYIDADQALAIGIEYCYTVTAVYEDCESPVSNEACSVLTDVPVVESGLSIYPNPSSSVVNIELTSNISQMVVYNYLGQVVYENNITGAQTLQLNVRNYESGAYLIKFVTREGETLTRKIVVTR